MKLRAINLPSQITYGRPEGQRANAFHRRKRMPFADFRSSPDVSGLCSARESKHAAQASALPLAHGDSSSNAQPQVVLAEASLPRAALKARQVQGRGEERPAGALRASSGSGDSRGPSQEPGQASSKPFAAGGPGWLEEASTPLGSASEAGSPTFTTSADGGSRFPQQQPRPAQQASTAVPTDRPFAAGPGGTWLEVASTPLGRPGAADPTPPTVPHTVAAQRPTVVRAEAYAKPAKRRGFTIGWLDFSGPDLSGLGPRGATYEILRRPGKKKVVQTAQEFKEEGSALLEGVVEDPARIVTSLEPTERPYAANSGPSNWLEAASKPIGRQPGAGEVGRIGVSQGTPAAVPSRSPGSLEGTARTISSTEASKRPFAAGDTIGWREAASTPQGGPSRTSPTEYLGKPFAAGDNVPSWLEAASTPLGGYKAPEGGATFTSTPRSAPHQGKVTARPGSLSTVTPRLVGSTGERAAEAISRTEPALRPFAAGPGSGNWLEAASTPIGARRIPIDSIKSAYRPAPQPSGILAVRPGSAAKVASKNPVSGEVAAKAISSTEPSRRPYAAGPGGGWLETASRPLGAGPSRPAAPGSTVKPFAAGFDTPGWLEAASTPLGGPKAPDGGATFTVDPRTIVPTQQQGKSTSRPGSRATVTSKGAATGERAAEAISRTEASKRPFAAGPGGWLDAVSTKLGAQTAPVDGKTAPRPVSSQQTGPGVAPVSFATVTDRRPSGGEGAAKAASSADPSKRPYAAGQGGGWLDAASKPLGRPGRVLPTEFLGKPFAAGDSVPGWLEAASTPLGSYSPPAGGATFELPRPQQTTAKPVSRPGSRATVTPKKFGTWGNAGEAAVQAEPTQRPFAADLSSSTVRSPAAATKPAKPFAAGPDTPGWREAASKPL